MGRGAEQSSRGQQTAAPGRGSKAIWVNYGNRTVTIHDREGSVKTEWRTAEENKRQSNRTEKHDAAQGREWFETKAVKRRCACLCVWWLYNSGRPWLVTVNDSNDDSL